MQIVLPLSSPFNVDGDPHRADFSGVSVQKGDRGNSALSPVDGEWMRTAIGACQRFAGATLSSRATHYTLIRELLRGIPDSMTPAEDVVLRGILLDTAVGWARQAHHLYHESGHCHGRDECRFAPADAAHTTWRTLRDTRPKQLFVQWARRFWRDFALTHPASPSERLARLLEEDCGTSATVARLARLVGCHHAMLRRQFIDAFGMSIGEYRNRLRIERALTLFAAGEPGKVVAARTGWKSRKNLYRALERFAGVRPSQMSAPALARLAVKLRLDRHEDAWRTRCRRHDSPAGAQTAFLNGGGPHRRDPR